MASETCDEEGVGNVVVCLGLSDGPLRCSGIVGGGRDSVNGVRGVVGTVTASVMACVEVADAVGVDVGMEFVVSVVISVVCSSCCGVDDDDVNGTFCVVDTGMFGVEVTGVLNVTFDSSAVVAVSCSVPVVSSAACGNVVEVTESVGVVGAFDSCVVSSSCVVGTTAIVVVVSAYIPAVVSHGPSHCSKLYVVNHSPPGNTHTFSCWVYPVLPHSTLHFVLSPYVHPSSEITRQY